MKILTQDEKDANYRATLKGGAIGGILGLGTGFGGIYLASKRYPGFRNLTIQFRTFIAVSIGTFSSIVAADRYSSAYELTRNKARQALLEHVQEQEKYQNQKPLKEKAQEWLGQHRYSIVMAVWVASMGGSLAIVSRNPYLTSTQKIVQARMYAQGLTLAALLGSFGLEAKDAAQKKGRWETIKVLDPNDPSHKRLIEKRVHHERYEGEDQWMDVIAAAEEREKESKAQHELEKRNIRKAQERAHAERLVNNEKKSS